MTQDEVYTILLKHSNKFSCSEFSELTEAIGKFGISEWREGRKEIKKVYNL
jgi:hypothetical protein